MIPASHLWCFSTGYPEKVKMPTHLDGETNWMMMLVVLGQLSQLSDMKHTCTGTQRSQRTWI